MATALLSMTSCLYENALVFNCYAMCDVRGSLLISDLGVTYHITENKTEGDVIGLERAYINFDVLSEVNENECNIRLRSYYEATKMDCLHKSRIESDEALGNDPISLTNGWFSGENFNACLQMIFKKGSTTKHIVNMVFDNEKSTQDTAFFHLRHNSFGENYGTGDTYASDSYISFPVMEELQSLAGDRDEIVFCIDWKWYLTNEKGQPSDIRTFINAVPVTIYKGRD